MGRTLRKGQLLLNFCMMLLSLLFVAPFVLLIIASFTDENILLKYGYSFFPAKFSLAAYQYLLTESSMILRAYGVSFLVTLAGTAVSLIVTLCLAYTISRNDYPLHNVFAFLVFFTMIFNGGLVPSYLMWTKFFYVKNTLWALIVPGLLMNGFNVIITKSYFSANIPPAIRESASVDGAGEIRTLLQVVLPLSLPIIATIGLFEGLAYWNDWFNGLIYLTDPKLFSIQVVLNQIESNIQFLQQTSLGGEASKAIAALPQTSIRMAIAVIGVVPILLAYPFFQKYFVKGITIGAIKG